MSRRHSLKSLVCAVVVPCALAACAGVFEPQYPITSQVSPDKGQTQFDESLLRNAKEQRVSHLAAFEHVEYARIETDDLILESVYDTAISVKTVLQYDYWMTRMADTWNLNNGQAKSWGKVGNVQAWHGLIEYQPYELANAARNCVAFNSEWGYQPRDNIGRPTRVFFGYVCAKPGKQLATSAAVKLIGSVRFPDTPVESLVPVNGRRSVDQVAFATAKGSAGAPTGNAEFPFNFGTVYVEGDGPERSSGQ